MATARIFMICCVKESTGTDVSVLNAVANLPATVLPDELGTDIVASIRAVPGVLEAIDAAREDPDDLYVTTETEGDRDRAIWPGPGLSKSILAGQSVKPDFSVPFSFSQNISLWDYDSGSGDDPLGSVTVFESEQGAGVLAKLAANPVEGSAYYVVYEVD
jgi:hypothetical protein